MPIKIFVFPEKGSQTEILLLHFPLQRKMKLGRRSPLALLSLGVIAVLQRLERRNAPLQPSSQSRHAAWSGFKIASDMGHGRDFSIVLRVCVRDAEVALVTHSAGPGGGWQSWGPDALQQPGGHGCWRLSLPAVDGASACPGIARWTKLGWLAGRLSGRAGYGGMVPPVPSTAPWQVPGSRLRWAVQSVGTDWAEDVCPSPRLCQRNFALKVFLVSVRRAGLYCRSPSR